jgi:hypothetical protein
MVTVTMTIEEYEALMDLVRSANGGSTSLMTSAPGAEIPEPKPKRRKRSKYNRELSRQLKMLKKKHPRTAITRLMKRAHSATKKALK